MFCSILSFSLSLAKHHFWYRKIAFPFRTILKFFCEFFFASLLYINFWFLYFFLFLYLLSFSILFCVFFRKQSFYWNKSWNGHDWAKRKKGREHLKKKPPLLTRKGERKLVKLNKSVFWRWKNNTSQQPIMGKYWNVKMSLRLEKREKNDWERERERRFNFT